MKFGDGGVHIGSLSSIPPKSRPITLLYIAQIKGIVSDSFATPYSVPVLVEKRGLLKLTDSNNLLGFLPLSEISHPLPPTCSPELNRRLTSVLVTQCAAARSWVCSGAPLAACWPPNRFAVLIEACFFLVPPFRASLPTSQSSDTVPPTLRT